MVKSFTRGDLEFAKAWNDVLAFPTVRDLVPEFNMRPEQLRRRATTLRAAGVNVVKRNSGGYPRGGRPLSVEDMNKGLEEDV